MQQKRLMRSLGDRKIGGVAAGMAQFFGLDPTLVRVLWVLGIVASGGFGFLAYLILWIVVPTGEQKYVPLTSAIGIVEERYARGEITAEEMQRMREDLESP